ncbi:conserved Plasmodium protein, unknown function [Plasmodium knowlesi strain H]|uniref:Uncharacterized protein n=3 Tax=Plasmodium knowlesi TaxID=5850 RepID=A0A5K1UN32_PLAKH|nr:conserved protein, unknown function [Plasmodium knowlesi strain H]OTN67374.1 Uncharacterized protein PKNOH_S06409800 [Plasmodium knowlesi]CAA9987373.1 conserved protein, unknown function [Plasmodium knowlesi strain H]SBO23335.1 conserved Plasmodium protein, unknown function [Plasmodium knowlesi strain H]SBO24450.1 conserved Plasmodium protein, unknown function [Plasmodium knowlesi strain H]VVS76847.1 conserved protein, unknown function [Plasmodium knowlesi strain H]|eukprot:XP_002258376.1 hypothetical protein, conserved in Plasmodium species [Plasmodium knowlesi strain H]
MCIPLPLLRALIPLLVYAKTILPLVLLVLLLGLPHCSCEEFEKIEYAQALTKIKYYDCNIHIDKTHLYKYVAKPSLQDLVVTVRIQKNVEPDNMLYFPKGKSYLKIAGDWSKYPKEKNETICLTFLLKKDLVKNKKEKCPSNIFSPENVYKVCYKENNYSIRNLFLYLEISQAYLEKLFESFNVPVVVNTENTVVYFTNNKKKSKDEKPPLDLHICYNSMEEKPYYLGKVIFNSYPMNIERNINEYDVIYTKSFLTSNWEYKLIIKGEYITSYNRIIFVKFARNIDDKEKKCPPFWNYAILGAGALEKIKRTDKSNITKNVVQYFFSSDDKSSTDYYIPFIKSDNLQTNENYLICLYSDENDFHGMELTNVHFYINTTDSIILIFLIIFVIVFLPLLFSLTYLCVLFKMNALKVKMRKLQLLNRKDEIEDRLKRELNLDQYECI